ncbi:hypothetical protein SNEBB_011404 [Seison nebaliae]|nr:hypothetical protein SNEBB_011404 [Seison nebaliae]
MFDNVTTSDTKAHNGGIHTLAWNNIGSKIASGAVDKCVNIFTLDNRGKIFKDCSLTGHTAIVDQLCWHTKNNNILATASSDRTSRIFDIRTQKCCKVIDTPGDNINISWSPDSNYIALGNKDDLISFVDTRTYKISQEQQFNEEINEITWNHTSNLFFLTTGSGNIRVYRWPQMRHLHTINAHLANCICIKFDSTGDYFVTGAADALVSLWDAHSLVCLNTFARLDYPVRTVSISHDSQYLASGSEDLFIDIAELASGRQIKTIKCPTSAFAIAWHPKKYLLAYSCDDAAVGYIRIWGIS